MPITDGPRRRCPCFAVDSIWLAAYCLLNGAQLIKVEVTGRKVYFHMESQTRVETYYHDFWDGHGTVSALAYSLKIVELQAEVLKVCPSFFKRAARNPKSPGPGAA